MENSDIISTLNDLLKATLDAENGFIACAEHISVANVKSILEHAAKMSADRAHVLESTIRGLGGEPSHSGSTGGALHRAWINVRSSIAGTDDHGVLAECERGEDAAKDVYEKALAKGLPLHIKEIIEQQYQGIKQDHDEIRALRDAPASKA